MKILNLDMIEKHYQKPENGMMEMRFPILTLLKLASSSKVNKDYLMTELCQEILNKEN